MCTSCLLISAIMMFTPASDGVQANQVNQTPLAQETQVAIVKMVNQLPKSSEMSLLRSGLLSLRSRLATVKNDVQAQNIINSELSSLSQRLSNVPSSEKVTEYLEDILIEDDNEQLIKGLTSPSAKPQTWGWLR
ncbi:MAG: hypothetical protein KME05_13570 [Gloeocapsa sp. UFS-A4-WI-NPMV-4B04]|nr:hypothetical protein [Gloeocapsa sp. UFS-A4-WI-NPMV-4B04]